MSCFGFLTGEAHCVGLSLFFCPQTGTSTAVLGALEISHSLRTRRQQAHHPQPADESQRSHQGGCAEFKKLCAHLIKVKKCWALWYGEISSAQTQSSVLYNFPSAFI